jgi:allophanate hydrolase
MTIDLGVHNLGLAYRAGTLTVRQVIDEVLRRIAAAGDDKVWISRVPDADLRAQADALDREGEKDLPLFGIPFAVKDNIDVDGLPTTAACPGFAYTPRVSAEVVQPLVEAGAIVIGKTNLDQFATGLVGMRSPYGVPRNPFNADYVPGGSSSGSAVAVASGLVSFALGTDTAGSGRVPAGFNNIVGLKPSLGRFSNRGVVPACASLDCVSVFALSCTDAALVSDTIASSVALSLGLAPFRFGVPNQLEFFGDREYASLYAAAVKKMESLGGTPVEFDYTPFRDAAQLLYAGPWVAERTAAVGDFIEKADAAAKVWPVTRDIILGGKKYNAVDAFRGQYALNALKARAFVEILDMEFVLLPTAGTIYTKAELEREPVLYNSNLGYYTNFVNFFGMSAVSLPAGFRSDGLPFGITLVGEAFKEQALLKLGARWQRAMPLPLGRTNSALPSPEVDPPAPDIQVEIAVVGAHMSGLPLNEQLTDLDAKLVRATRTAPHYRLYALPGGPPRRPGMVRVAENGSAIELEVWSLWNLRLAKFMNHLAEPLSIGNITLADGSTVLGFLCEGYAIEGAKDITSFGGWRAYLKSLS